jgi:hypothetical protein
MSNTSSNKILNEVEKVVKEYVNGKGEDKDKLKDYLFDSSKSLYEEVKACKDLAVLKALLDQFDKMTDELDPKMLMIIGFYNRFGKVIDEAHSRITDISSTMKVEDMLTTA